jgi:hypothetical protein
MFNWFGEEKKDMMKAKKGAISESNAGNQDATQNSKTASPTPGAAKVPTYETYDAVLEFLKGVFPCGLSETGQKLREKLPETLIEQFYFIGPVGERFFHWFFILGGADKQIIWNTKEKTVKSLEAWELKNKDHIDNVPFWRAVALVRDSLIKHLSSKTKGEEKGGLYFAGENKLGSGINSPEGSASEIFSVEQIYTHAKDTFAHGFKNFPQLSLTEELATTGSAPSVTDSATREAPRSQNAQIFEQKIRGQLEFEWLITRPYSPCWSRKKKEQENNDTGPTCWSRKKKEQENNDTGPTVKGEETNNDASCWSGKRQSPTESRGKMRESSVFDFEMHTAPPDTSTRISDGSLGRNTHNVFWDWNESMWQSAVKAVKDATDPAVALNQQQTEGDKSDEIRRLKEIAVQQCVTIFCERTVDYQHNFTGENLFHL